MFGAAQMDAAKSRSHLAFTLTQHASAKRSTARVQLVGTLIGAGTTPNAAMATARQFIPSPVGTTLAHQPIPHLALPSSTKISTATTTEGTYTSPVKMPDVFDLASCSPPVAIENCAPISSVSYIQILCAGISADDLLDLSPEVMKSIKELAQHCENMKGLGEQVDQFAKELEGACDDNSVIAAMQRIKARVQRDASY